MIYGFVLGALGGGAAAVWGATQVWPIITSAIPGVGGFVCAIFASIAMWSVGICAGACATALGCGIVGSCTEGAYLRFAGLWERFNSISLASSRLRDVNSEYSVIFNPHDTP